MDTLALQAVPYPLREGITIGESIANPRSEEDVNQQRDDVRKSEPEYPWKAFLVSHLH